MVQLPDDAPSPRLCVIEKTSVNQEYGYNLHAEKGRGQFVGMVDKNSPAELGGLRMGDRIFAVNGHSIVGESHKKVVERIKENALRCEMLVISDEGAKWYMEHGIQITPQLPNIHRVSTQDNVASSRRSSYTNNTSSPTAGWYAPISNKNADPVFVAPPPPPHDDPNMSKPKPRLCRLEKSSPSDEFGFNLHAEKGRGHFIGTVDQDGIGDRSGLRIGQRIVGVNGLLIFPNTPHKEVVALIKKSQLSTTLLVASEEVDKWYKEHSEMYSFDYAEDGIVQLSPHSIHISDDEELNEPVRLKQKELEHVEHLQHDLDNIELEEVHEMSTSVANSHNTTNHYDSVPSRDEQISVNNDDIMNAVFSVLPSAPDILLQSEEMPQSEIQFVRSPSVTESDKHSVCDENAIGLHHCDPSYLPKPIQQEHSQVSPVSNGSSLNGYHSSSNNASPSADKFDIFGLSAKEARERLRQNKKNHYKGFDMSLEEKYRLVSNM